MDTTGSGSGLVPDQPGRGRLRPDQPPGGHPTPGRDMKGAADLPGREISGSDSREP